VEGKGKKGKVRGWEWKWEGKRKKGKKEREEKVKGTLVTPIQIFGYATRLHLQRENEIGHRQLSCRVQKIYIDTNNNDTRNLS